jgi:catechol 2,3-dioxygenase-like lactoylglutathione lyase family enzyme
MQVQGGATAFILQLRAQRLELLQFDHPGNSYPRDADSAALIFQHFAIVVTDMAAAYHRLRAGQGWEAISRGGPQQLPSSSGGAVAFKFRDPEGHPLELLAPRLSVNAGADAAGAVFSGIDHSAISVSDTARSVGYYTGFGLAVSGGSLNSGIEQERLDGLASPQVEVTALAGMNTTPPHLELLCYRQPRPRWYPPLASNDIATTRLIFQRLWETPASQLSQRCIDPDGHHLIFE